MSATQFLLGMSVRFRQYQRSQASQHTQNLSESSLHTKSDFGHMVLSSSSSCVVSFATIWSNGGSETYNCLAFLVSSAAIFSFSFVFSSSSALLSVRQTVNAGFLFLFDFFSGFGKTSNLLKIPDDGEPVREDCAHSRY